MTFVATSACPGWAIEMLNTRAIGPKLIASVTSFERRRESLSTCFGLIRRRAASPRRNLRQTTRRRALAAGHDHAKQDRLITALRRTSCGLSALQLGGNERDGRGALRRNSIL